MLIFVTKILQNIQCFTQRPNPSTVTLCNLYNPPSHIIISYMKYKSLQGIELNYYDKNVLNCYIIIYRANFLTPKHFFQIHVYLYRSKFQIHNIFVCVQILTLYWAPPPKIRLCLSAYIICIYIYISSICFINVIIISVNCKIDLLSL